MPDAGPAHPPNEQGRHLSMEPVVRFLEGRIRRTQFDPKPSFSLVNHHRFESLPNNRFGTAHHLINKTSRMSAVVRLRGYKRGMRGVL